MKVDYEQLNSQLRKFKKEIDVYIEKDFEADKEKYLEKKRKWNNSLLSVEQLHKPWSIKRIQDMEAYFFTLKQYQRDVLPAFLIEESKKNKFNIPEEVTSTIERINSLNSAYKQSDEIKFYLNKTKQSLDIPNTISINTSLKPKVVNIEKWKVPAIHKNKEHEFLKLGPHLLKEPSVVAVIFVIATILF